MELTLDEPKKNEKPEQVNGVEVLLADYDPVAILGAIVDYAKVAGKDGFIVRGKRAGVFPVGEIEDASPFPTIKR